MDLKTDKIENLVDYGKEVCLQNLLLISRLREDLNIKGDISGVERIDEKLIPVYENIYKSLNLENIKELLNEDENNLKKIKDTLEKILKDSNFDKKFVLEQQKLRAKFKEKSGAEVVKRFNEYKLKEYKKKRNLILKNINEILDEEEKLNLDLSNAIQEIEQLEIIEKLQPIREKYRNLESQLNLYQKEIENCEKILEKKWPYEIYGTREEKEFLDIFLSVYDNIHI